LQLRMNRPSRGPSITICFLRWDCCQTLGIISRLRSYLIVCPKILIQYIYSHPPYPNLSRTHETYHPLAEISKPTRFLALLLVYLILLKERHLILKK
jgi:hypothetical protein